MPDSLSNSKDMIANSISLINQDGTVSDMKDTITNIEGLLIPERIQTISDIRTAVNHDPTFLDNNANSTAEQTHIY